MSRKAKYHAYRATILTLPVALGWDIRELLMELPFRGLKPFLLHALRQEFRRQVERRVLIQDVKKAMDIADLGSRHAAIDAAYARFEKLRQDQIASEMRVAADTAVAERNAAAERRSRERRREMEIAGMAA